MLPTTTSLAIYFSNKRANQNLHLIESFRPGSRPLICNFTKSGCFILFTLIHLYMFVCEIGEFGTHVRLRRGIIQRYVPNPLLIGGRKLEPKFVHENGLGSRAHAVLTLPMAALPLGLTCASMLWFYRALSTESCV